MILRLSSADFPGLAGIDPRAAETQEAVQQVSAPYTSASGALPTRRLTSRPLTQITPIQGGQFRVQMEAGRERHGHDRECTPARGFARHRWGFRR